MTEKKPLEERLKEKLRELEAQGLNKPTEKYSTQFVDYISLKILHLLSFETQEMGQELVYLTDALFDKKGKKTGDETEFFKRFEEVLHTDWGSKESYFPWYDIVKRITEKQGSYRAITSALKEFDDLTEQFGL
jgi:hypothetical protein